MSFGTIQVLITVDDVPANPSCVDVAMQLALSHRSRLIAIAHVRPIHYPSEAGVLHSSDLVAELTARQVSNAESLREQFELRAAKLGIKSVESHLLVEAAPLASIRTFRLADLIVVSQPDPVFRQETLARSQLVQLVVGGGCPVLFVPYAGRFESIGERALVAWSPTPECQRAVIDAMPILRHAAKVDVLTIRPNDGDQRGSDKAEQELRAYFSHNGIDARLHVETSAVDVGNTILSRAANFESNVIVMGCYGHSRLRELLVGGISLNVLRSMTVPLFMAH